MDLSAVFAAVLAAAATTQYLDWSSTVKLIAKKGLAGESNPIIKFMFGKSKYLALAYKMAPLPALVYAGWFHKGGDVQNFLVQYVNAPAGQLDHWALAWIGCGLFSMGVGLVGYLHNRNVK